MKRAFLPFLIIVLAAACAQPEAPDQMKSPPPSEAKAVPVKVAVLELAPFDDELRLFGQVQASYEANVAAETPGRVESVPVVEGSVVRKGQTLVRINGRIANAQVLQAQAGFKMAEATFSRTKKLAEKKLAAAAELDMAEAQKDQAAASLELAKANFDQAVIRAPKSGQTTSIVVEAGDYVNPGQPLLKLVDISWVEVQIGVPERDIPFMKSGASAKLAVQAFPGEAFSGTIGDISISADPKTRSFRVPVNVENQGGRLRPGMLAQVVLPREALEGALVIPRDAVLEEPGQKVVFITDGKKAKRRVVELGATRGAFTVVRAGIEVGDKLLVSGHRQVVDGQRVDIKDTQPCCKAQVQKNAPGTAG